jgi:hypothetical protein
MRAVIAPALRRALPVWLGTGIVAAVIFGGTGMAPRDLTGLALRTPGVAVGLGLTWALLFVPVARLLVRADATRFLRSLPHARWVPRVVAGSALLALQLPWLALWIVGEGGLGGALAVAFTPIIAVVARGHAKPPRGAPVWRGPVTALLGVYLRALRRRASDAVLRLAGLALLAGATAGLFVRNNALEPAAASVLATSVIVVVLVPGWAGALLSIVEAHAQSRWLASSLGASDRTRIGVLGLAIGIVYVGGMALALGLAALVARDAWVVPVGLAASPGLAMVVTRGALWAGRSTTPAAKLALATVLGSSLAVVLLGWLGPVGVIALATAGLVTVPGGGRGAAGLAGRA